MAEPDTVQADIVPPAIIPDTNTDAPPSPVHVDLDSGEVIDAPSDGDQEPQKPNGHDAEGQQPPKRMPRTQARIQNLSKEKERLEAELAAARREAEEAKRLASENAAARETAERAGMENYELRVKADVEAAKRDVASAIAANDATALVEAQTRLAKAAAAEADVDAWRSAHPKQEPRHQQQPQQHQPQPQPQYQQTQQVQVSEPVRNFMLENPWFNPYQIDENGQLVIQNGRPVENPDFDPEMRDAALLRDTQIKREIRLGRKPADFLESDDYFSDILGTVSSTFPDAFEEPPPAPPPPQQRPRAPQMQPARQPVAPTQRQAMPGQQPQKPGNRVQLSGEERSFVDSLVENKTMRYPRDHPDAAKRGQVMTKQDAYVKYAKERAADQAVRGNG